MLALAVTWWLYPFVLITLVIYGVILPSSLAPKHDQSFTQLFKLSIGITTAALTPNVLLYRCYKSNSPLAFGTFWERGLNSRMLSGFVIFNGCYVAWDAGATKAAEKKSNKLSTAGPLYEWSRAFGFDRIKI